MLPDPTTAVANDPNRRDDATLLRRWLGGDDDAASALHDRYAERLARLARHHLPPGVMDADDIVQSAFRRFFQAAKRGTYDVPGREDLWPLLAVIALNRLRNERDRRYTAKRYLDAQRDAASPADHEGPLGAIIVEETLSRLPEVYRAVIRGRIEGREVAEIAALSGRSLRTVERLLQQSRERLLDLMREDGDA